MSCEDVRVVWIGPVVLGVMLQGEGVGGWTPTGRLGTLGMVLFGVVLGIAGLAPGVYALQSLVEEDRRGPMAVMLFKFLELIVEALPQSAMQASIGVSYGPSVCSSVRLSIPPSVRPSARLSVRPFLSSIHTRLFPPTTPVSLMLCPSTLPTL